MKVTVIFLSLLSLFGLGAAAYFLYNNNNMRKELTDRDTMIKQLETSCKNLQIHKDSLASTLDEMEKEQENLSNLSNPSKGAQEVGG